MACASYLSRRDGRYYLQVRLNAVTSLLLGKQFYRVSLRTSDYRQARIRLSEHLGWIHRMNASANYVSLFQKNVGELRRYLLDPWPLSEERLQARRNYEEMLKNLKLRALAAQCDPDMIEPDFTALLNRFVNQNLDAETFLRQRDKVQAYERSRADMQAAIQMGAVPASFKASAHHPPAIPSQPDTIAAWHDPMASSEAPSLRQCASRKFPSMFSRSLLHTPLHLRPIRLPSRRLCRNTLKRI